MRTDISQHNEINNFENNSINKLPSGSILQDRKNIFQFNKTKFEEEKSKEDSQKMGIKIKINEKNYMNSEEYNDLKIRYKELEGQNSKLKLNIEEMKFKLSEKDNIIDQLKKIEIESKKIIEDLQNKIKKLEEQILIYKNQEKVSKLELEKMQSKFSGALTQFQGMNNKINEQNKKLEELSICKKENKDLKEKNKFFEKVIQQGETKEDYLIKPAEKYYDVIIDINSINSLKNEGWAIKYNKERKEIYDKIISEETIKIGVLGLNNVGKSFLLSKIVNGEIPIGYSIETKGISIKYAIQDDKEKNPKEINGICILDSAGFETPLLRENKKSTKTDNNIKDNKDNEEGKSDPVEEAIKFGGIEDNLSSDKAQTERFIEQLIISLSDMIILVVGKLTRTEQKLITRIKNLSIRNEKNKIRSIIIVHNLSQYHKIAEVNKHIEQYLNRSATFKLKERKFIGEGKFDKRNYFVEDSDESEEIQIFHYIMAKEGTEAGNYFNDFTMELIKNQFNNFNKRREINIPDEIINLFSELSTEILGEKMECYKSEKDSNVIKLLEKENKKKNKIIIIKQAYIDQDGNYLKNKDKFEPKYSLHYYKEKNEEEDEYENYLLLRLEIPGNVIRLTARSTNPKNDKYNGIFIKGIKKEDDFKEKSKEDFTTISDNRNYEEFTYFIELNRNLELSKSSATGQTQIYEIQFDKRNKEKFFPKENIPTISRQNTLKENNSNNEGEKLNKDDKNLIKIASGVYVMKFLLTERSSIP